MNKVFNASIVLLVMLLLKVNAENIEWIGSSEGDMKWGTATNWSTQNIPTTNDLVVVNGGSVEKPIEVDGESFAKKLTLGNLESASSFLEINSSLTAFNMVVAEKGFANVEVTPMGSLVISGTKGAEVSLNIGGSEEVLSEATLIVNGGSVDGTLVSANHLRVGTYGYGKIVQNGGSIKFNRSLHAAYGIDSLSEIYVTNGIFSISRESTIAKKGRFVGRFKDSTISFGRGYTSSEEYGSYTDIEFVNCTVSAQDGAGGSKGIYLADNGESFLRIKDSTLTLSQKGITVRGLEDGVGALRGNGAIGIYNYKMSANATMPILNNGKIIADGYGEEKDLSFTEKQYAQLVFSNTIPNTESNDWFAENKGRLVFSPIDSTAVEGSVSFTIGDNIDQEIPTLVNAARISLTGVVDGNVATTMNLLAPDRSSDGVELLSTSLGARRELVNVYHYTTSPFESGLIAIRVDEHGFQEEYGNFDVLLYIREGDTWNVVPKTRYDNETKLVSISLPQNDSGEIFLGLVVFSTEKGTLIIIK